MKKTVYILSALFPALTAVFALIYSKTGAGVYLTLAITAGTAAYHFLMRLAVGLFFKIILGNRADYNKKWYRTRPIERRIYRKLRVAKWSVRVPAFEPETFDLKTNSLEDIAKTMCRAELVHETIAVLSLVPVLFSLRFGSPAVFIITSLLSMCFDLVLVAVQRCNRPRVLRLMARRAEKEKPIDAK